MASTVLDEAVRRQLCAGARLDRIAALDNFCWPDPVRSETTPDGEYKLAQLVRACRGLHEVCLAYGVPLISGKDSMKNESTMGGVKISVPPTLLLSAIGQIDDVREALTLDLKQPETWSTFSVKRVLTPGPVSTFATSATVKACDPSSVSRPPSWGGARRPSTPLERYLSTQHSTGRFGPDS